MVPQIRATPREDRLRLEIDRLSQWYLRVGGAEWGDRPEQLLQRRGGGPHSV